MAISQGKLRTIPDLKVAMGGGLPLIRHQVAASAPSLRAYPLIPRTAPFAEEWMQGFHENPAYKVELDIACYYASDAIVSGSGQIWFDDHLVVSDEVMPKYVVNYLGIGHGGDAQLLSEAKLPLKIIEPLCLVAVGHGSKVYGHFLTEMLFRILVSYHALFQTEHRPYRVLLDFDSPRWLLRILEEDLGIGPQEVEFFFPQQERVLLRQAIIPTRVFHDHGAHPFANEMIQGLLDRLNIQPEAQQPSRIFVVRGQFQNPASPPRICTNEKNLIDIAVNRYGFIAVSAETMNWRRQIALFRDAEIILGQAGSGLLNAVFSKPGSRLASIGINAFVQHRVGALRRQHMAFLMRDVHLKGEFTVDEKVFDAFLEEVCT